MKHIFIINPRAGKKSGVSALMDQIEALRRTHGLFCETLLTARPGHAEEMARRAAQSGEKVRIYACGGDGTLNEVANGVVGAENVEVTVVPMGTGNDFLKNFGEDRARFLDLEQLWDAPVHDLDMIECNGRVALTVVCAGLDARVADDVHRYSKAPAVSGQVAYIASLGVNFFKNLSNRITITEDGRATIGEYIIVCVCNGRYYGGGFMPVAAARMDDGILDMVVVRKLARPMILRLLPDYAKGRGNRYPKIVQSSQPRAVHLQTREPLAVSMDGEIRHEKDISIRMCAHKLHFFAPAGASCNRTATP